VTAIISLDTLAVPGRAFTVPAQPGKPGWDDEILALADRLHAEQDWPALAHLYQRAADIAWKQGHRVASVRLLLAERVLAERVGDQRRIRECTYFIATRHRLQASFTAAEAWARMVLRMPLTTDSATMHVAVLRELTAIHEVRAEYEPALAISDQAESLCRRYAAVPGMPAAHVKTLLQRSVLLRLQGSVDRAADAVRRARDIAETADVDELTRGLIRLREGGLQVVIGRADAALDAYLAAEQHFDGVSEHNLLLAKTRQIAPLRALGRHTEALAIADQLAGIFQSDADPYRRGQVLLERAEVLHDLGDQVQVRNALEQARPFFEHASTLEALRWHTHMARMLVNRGEELAPADAARAIQHLCLVLRSAARPDRIDITRTLLALHELTRIPQSAGMPAPVRFAACRAALLAAVLQRDSLSNPAERWAMNAIREEVYAAAVLLHAAAGDSDAVAWITEAGRADLLNQLLSAGRHDWEGPLTELPIAPKPRDPGLADRVFLMAAAIRVALEQGTPLEDAGSLPHEEALSAGADLDELADMIALIHLAHNGVAWLAAVATRPRGGGWAVTVTAAPPAVAVLLDKLANGELLLPRGISARTWEQFGSFLLPEEKLWTGTKNKPGSVLICPDPRLWQVPYPALTRSGTCLVEVAEVTLTPSLRTSCLLRERAKNRRTDADRRPAEQAVLTVLDSGLPGHEIELAALRSWPGGQRSLPAVDKIARDSDHALLYVSGHGDKPGTVAELGPTGINLHQLATSELPPLVVLNGCWSGTTDGRFGQDPFSLAVGALIGGADAVAAGIGQIDSATSAHIAAQALAFLRAGMPIGTALRHAQNQVRSAHPELTAFDWAGLCVVGLA
jgi:tetratricopeptide (TPR) repeat protein